ncbi:MAG: hypothetical protein ACT4OZ_15520 [Gemmatimonadota bacterium]
MISALDPASSRDVNAVAALHEEHLADSPIAQLGPRFLRSFFYSTLVRDGLVGVFVCHLDGEVIGFLSYTAYPGDFIGRGVRRHPLRLAWIMLRTLVARDRSVRDLWSVAAFVARRGRDQETPAEASTAGGGHMEAISLVAPPKHQKHIPPGGKSRLTIRLVETMAEHARAHGVARVVYTVSPRNTASNLLFNALGCDFEKRTYAGTTSYFYTHRIPLSGS